MTSPAGARTYIDVALHRDHRGLDWSTIDGDEFTLGGFGGQRRRRGSGAQSWLGNGTYRFLLDGDFRAGRGRRHDQPVDTFATTAPARAPPADWTDTQASPSPAPPPTCPDRARAGDTPETVVALGG